MMQQSDHSIQGLERFQREIDAMAPRPGRGLAYVSFVANGRSYMLRAIEGGPRDSMSFRGIVTDFKSTQVLNFHATGTFIDLLEDLPYSPYDARDELEFVDFATKPHIPFPVSKVTIIWNKVPSERDLQPDVALVQLQMSGRAEPLLLHFGAIRRGWCAFATVVVVGLVCLGALAIVEHHSQSDSVEIEGTVKKGDTEISGSVTTGPGPATAPVTSGHP
jgi:hypothetical protein